VTTKEELIKENETLKIEIRVLKGILKDFFKTRDKEIEKAYQ